LNPDTVSSRFSLPDWDHPPKRVVSLVPSITESLFALGFGESVVGVTDFCTHPAADLVAQVRVGGPKAPNLEIIAELKPDLVIGSVEETEKDRIEALHQQGIAVWLVFPKSVDDSIQMLRQILALYHTDDRVELITQLQIAVDYARAAAASEPTIPYFCPIWFDQHQKLDWWMTFNQNTYVSDVLALFGGQNVFADRVRLYPLEADLGLTKPEESEERDTRYPRVTAAEIIAAQPELILLPDDPYKFSVEDRKVLEYALADTPAVRQGRVFFIDGRPVTWYGVHLGQALRTLPEYFHNS
jgi:ABC-type Fe3+-hydroxamate transport system substrate-binding protein